MTGEAYLAAVDSEGEWTCLAVTWHPTALGVLRAAHPSLAVRGGYVVAKMIQAGRRAERDGYTLGWRDG